MNEAPTKVAFTAEALDDVHCDHCGRRIGAYVGLAQCKKCGWWKRVRKEDRCAT